MPTEINVELDISPVEIAATVNVAPVEIEADIGVREGPPGLDAIIEPIARVPRGEAISGARGVYLAVTEGEVRAFAASAMDEGKWAIGFVVEAGPEGEQVDVWQDKVISGLSEIQNAAYFLGAAGQFAITPPAGARVVQRMGIGVSPSAIAGQVEPPSFIEP